LAGAWVPIFALLGFSNWKIKFEVESSICSRVMMTQSVRFLHALVPSASNQYTRIKLLTFWLISMENRLMKKI
jgi:hypothetical protein